MLFKHIVVRLLLERHSGVGAFKEVIENKISTSSRGISSFLSHLLGHGSGSLGHSSAKCAWKKSFTKQSKVSPTSRKCLKIVINVT